MAGSIFFDYSNILQDGRAISAFPYFSDLIGGIVGGVLDHGECFLPTLDESISQHLLLEDIFETLAQRPNIT